MGFTGAIKDRFIAGFSNLSNASLSDPTDETFSAVFSGDTTSSLGNTVESQVQNIMPTSCLWSRMSFNCLTNTLDGNTPITFRINSVDGNLTITLPLNSGAVILQDTTNSDATEELDLLTLEYDQTASTAGQAGRVHISFIGET